MKVERHSRILAIIGEQHIQTQSQLLEALRAEGISATQTTVSRDLDELHIRRERQADGRRRYTLSSYLEGRARDAKLQRVFSQSVTRLATAQNLLVIHTLPGMAGAAAGAVDAMELPAVAGAVAGDDTVFVALRDREAAEALAKQLKGLF